MGTDAEQGRLEQIAGRSVYAVGVNAALIRYGISIFARSWRGTSCLELGPAEGLASEVIAEHFPDLTIVDGSELFAQRLRERFPRATVVCSLFEDWEPGRTFDRIVLGHVLEHVEDPVALLRRAAAWLRPGGQIQMSVPNARSLHRQAGVLMGRIDTLYTFSEKDHAHGHRRIYDPDSLRADVLAAGLEIVAEGGWLLKPVADAQIEADWSPELLAAYMRLGERYPEIAANIYVVAAVNLSDDGDQAASASTGRSGTAG